MCDVIATLAFRAKWRREFSQREAADTMACANCGDAFKPKRTRQKTCCTGCSKEYAKARVVKYREENREKIRKQAREARRNNIERVREQRRRYREKRREYLREQQREYTKKNRERILQSQREYRAKNPDKVRQWSRNERRRKNAAYALVKELAGNNVDIAKVLADG